jgi:hypothetical protein
MFYVFYCGLGLGTGWSWFSLGNNADWKSFY